MKNLLLTGIVWLFMAFFLIGTASEAKSLVSGMAGKEAYVPGEILVQFKPGINRFQSEIFLRHLGRADRLKLPVSNPLFEGIFKVELQGGLGVSQAVSECQSDPSVLWAEPNVRYYALGCPLPTDQYYSSPYNWPLQQISAPQAWQNITWNSCPPGCSVTVAVIDTGVTRSHPDLPPSLFVPGYNAFTGLVDPPQPTLGLAPYTTVEPTDDDFGHGTFVSSLLWAQWQSTVQPEACNPGSSTTGMAGLAPGVKLMPVKVLDNTGSGSAAGVAYGTLYAIENGAKVLNLSLGGMLPDYLQYLVLQYAMSNGCVAVASSGDDGTAVPLLFPASFTNPPYSLPALISVGATDASGGIAFYSNSGPGLDLVAPGGSAMATGNFTLDASQNVFGARLNCPFSANPADFIANPADSNFCIAAGTSASAPYVSGTAALMFCLCPNLTNVQVTQAIISNTDLLPGQTGWTPTQGYGLLDVYKALSSISSCIPAPTWTFTPTVTVTQTPTGTPTRTVTNTRTATDTRTPTNTRTVTDTRTPTRTPTITPTRTNSPTITATHTVTNTRTVTDTHTPTHTRTVTETHTPTGTVTNTRTVTETRTPTNTRTVTDTRTPTRTATITPTRTNSPTTTATRTVTNTRTVTETRTPTNTLTETTTITPSPTPTNTSMSTATSTLTNTPTLTPTPSVTSTPGGCCYNFSLKWGTSGSDADGSYSFGNPVYDIALDNSTNCNGQPGPCVYVTDQANNLVDKFDTSGSSTNFILSFGGTGSGNGNLNGPYEIAVNSAGTSIYVADQGNSRVEVFGPTGGYLNQWGTSGIAIGQFAGLFGVAVDPVSNNVYTVDEGLNGRVQEFTYNGGAPGGIPTQFGESGGFSAPKGICVSNTELVYVLDGTGVHQFTAAGVATGISWSSIGVNLTADSAGYIYVAGEGLNPVSKYDPNGNPVCQIATGPDEAANQIGYPLGVAVSPSGVLYVNSVNMIVGEYVPCGPTPTAVALSVKIAALSKNAQRAETPTSTMTPTFTVTPSPTLGNLAVVVAPNISRNDEPIQFKVQLPGPAQVHLSLYTLLGEQIYQSTIAGNAGLNNLLWQVQNQSGQAVASSLYLYALEVNNGSGSQRWTGKVVVIH